MTNSNLTAIGVVLDRSGSMQSCVTDTIGGFNRFLADQKALPGECRLTLYQFDNVYEAVHVDVPLASVPELTTTSYVPRGSTALLDAVGQTINTMGQRFHLMREEERPSKVVIVIITDGQENASVEFRLSQIRSMIDEQRKNWNWQFLFLGAGESAIRDAQNMGIPLSGAAMYNNKSAAGNAAVYSVASSKVRGMRLGGQSCGFTDKDREDLNAK